MGHRATSPILVGRDDDLARLVQLLESAVAGQPAMALVAGEAGVGKSRLVQELAARAGASGAFVSVGRCVNLGESIWPLAPLREIVMDLVDRLDDDVLDTVVGDARPLLAALVPDLGATDEQVSAVAADRVVEMAIGVVRRLARRCPVVLVIEDVHWADATTRTLVATLARIGVRGVLFVATFRSDEIHRRHPLLPMLGEIERSTVCDRIDVRPFDRAVTAELVAALTGQPAPRQYVDAVQRRTGGNAYFVEALVTGNDGAGGVPDSLRDVVLGRADELAGPAEDVIAAIAIAGATSTEVIGDACRLDREETRAAIGVLIERALVVHDGELVRFRHELAREVFHDEIVAGERAQWHRAVASATHRHRPDRLGEIAVHWAAAHEARLAFSFSVAAGRQALRTGAAAEAEGHLARALDLWDVVEDPAALVGLDQAALLVETAVAAENAGHLERAIELDLAAVRQLDADAERQAEVWLKLRELYRFLLRWQECGDATSAALALVPAAPPTSLRARALASAAGDVGLGCREGDELALATEAVSVAERAGDAEAILVATSALGWALGETGEREARLEIARANLARFQLDLPAELALRLYNDLTNALAAVGRYEEIVPYAARGTEIARRSGLAGQRGSWMATYWVESLALLGRWREAEAVVEANAELLSHSRAAVPIIASWVVALVRQGRVDEARPLVEDARALLGATEWEQNLQNLADVMATILQFDAVDAPDRDPTPVIDRFFELPPGPRDQDAVFVDCAIGVLARQMLDGPWHDRRAVHRAIATAARLLSCIDDDEGAAWHPHLEQRLLRDRARANLARLRGDDEPGRWETLANGWTALGRRYDEADAWFRHAAALLAGPAGRTDGHRRLASTSLTAAHAVATDLGAVLLLHDIADLAHRARLAVGGPVPGPGSPAGDDPLRTLTAREREVLQLLAHGRTNGQIGAELFISTKTASVHVSNIIRKLGVANRVEAAASAGRAR